MAFASRLQISSARRAGGSNYILHGMNPERILVAAEAVGLGRAALRKAVDYAGKREVFDRPIGGMLDES
jgi:acyl-CoA dehydrogenase